MASTSKGNCYICGSTLGKTAMKNHLLKEHGGEADGQTCFLLKAEGAEDKNYWLYFDLPITSTLNDVDKFLRKIWLECCGHMSEFSSFDYTPVGKTRKLNTFSEGDQLLHEYDMGTTTTTLITFVGKVVRKQQKTKVRLLARNVSPEFKCIKCGAPAEYVCTECACDIEQPYYCAACAEKHEHVDMLLPITNSPRMGQCAYDGKLDTFAFVPPVAK